MCSEFLFSLVCKMIFEDNQKYIYISEQFFVSFVIFPLIFLGDTFSYPRLFLARSLLFFTSFSSFLHSFALYAFPQVQSNFNQSLAIQISTRRKKKAPVFRSQNKKVIQQAGYIINTWWLVPRETVNFVSRDSAEGNIEIRGKQVNRFPRDDLLYNPRRIKNFRVQLYENKSREQSAFADNWALLPSDVIDFAMLPAQRIWREIVPMSDVMWHRSNQWQRALEGKIPSYMTIFNIDFKAI